MKYLSAIYNSTSVGTVCGLLTGLHLSMGNELIAGLFATTSAAAILQASLDKYSKRDASNQNPPANK